MKQLNNGDDKIGDNFKRVTILCQQERYNQCRKWISQPRILEANDILQAFLAKRYYKKRRHK